MADLYEVLQVDRRADPDVIRAAYRALARKYHPDFGGDGGHMVAINEAWAVLGQADRRAAYDAEPKGAEAPSGYDPPSGDPSVAGSHGLGNRRPQDQPGAGSVLDFGRYAGWTVGSLLNHDPDYLEWLARTPIGRRLAPEIDAALARRSGEAEVLRPVTSSKRRGSFLRQRAREGPSAAR